MPSKPLKLCNHPGCNVFVAHGNCEAHTTVYQSKRSYAHMYNNPRWVGYRKRFLIMNPLCAECLKDKQLTTATIVDHIIPHKGDTVLFWDAKNHQPLCKRHHDIKTAKEDGGWGNNYKNR